MPRNFQASTRTESSEALVTMCLKKRRKPLRKLSSTSPDTLAELVIIQARSEYWPRETNDERQFRRHGRKARDDVGRRWIDGRIEHTVGMSVATKEIHEADHVARRRSSDHQRASCLELDQRYSTEDSARMMRSPRSASST